jgi:chaperonin GroEL
MAKHHPNWQTPEVVFQPKVYKGMQGGINKLVAAIRPTLGPLPRLVLNEKESKVGRPELLDDGAVIARRIIQLQDRDEDMGAMYLRQVLWHLHETVGDGTAAAAVLFQTIFTEGIRYIVAGGNAMRLRQYLEAAYKVILDELEKQVIHLEGKEQLARLAETICYDPPLAKMLGEIFDIIGEYGRLEFRTDRGREMDREYVEGMYWDGGILSREMFSDRIHGRAQLENLHILCTDLEIKEAQELLPVLDMAATAGIKSLLLIAASLSERALAMLLANRAKIGVVAVKAPALDSLTRSEALEDLALQTGGRAFFQAAGDTLNSVRLADLGQARRAWVEADQFGIVGGRGDPRRLRQHIAQLRLALQNVADPDTRKRLQQRIGKMIGGSAVLWAGGNTPIALEARKALAERTAEAMRGAIRDGVLPGGGVALLACQAALQKKKQTAESIDERMAYHILTTALETPMRALLENSGFKPDEILSRIAQTGPGYGFDVIKGEIVGLTQAGIYDAASVIKAATFSAIHGAALALTVDVLIHRKDPPLAYHKT